MATRIVEWKKPYTWWKAITVDENKVISLNLRDEDNLIIYDEEDNEIYVDLQLPDWLTPASAFPVGVTTGRVASEDWWDVTGTIVSFETTSGNNIKLLYEDGENWTLWINNNSNVFKRIYFKWDVDTLIQNLRTYVDEQLATKQDEHTVITVTLLANWWSGTTQTVTATGVTATNTVIISPDPSDFSDYTSAIIYCSAQWVDSLTFACDTIPSNDIDVNVVILD